MIHLYRYCCLCVVAAVALTSCQNRIETVDADDGYMHIVGVEVGVGNPQSRASESSTLQGDTVWLDDEVFVTAEVRDQLPDTAVVTRGTPLPNIAGIKDMRVIIYNTGSDDYSEENSTSLEDHKVTAGQEYKFDGKGYLWPEGTSGKHTFFLFSPDPTTENGLTLFTDKKKLIYTMVSDVTKQSDLLLSDVNRNNNLNVVNAIGSKNNLQRFYLKHALTAIGFEAVGWDLKVTGVELSNINTRAVIDLYSHTWEAIQTPATRSAGMIPDNWLMSNNKNEWKNVTNSDGYLMVVPQTIPDDAELTFKYEGRGLQPASGSYKVKLKELGVEWTAGKKVIYRLRLKTRPAVIPDNHLIEDFRGGYASKQLLGISAATDDNLTFTWEAPWLRAHRGNAGAVNIDGGLSSGFVTGVNNWNNIRFFATTDNNSALTERKAIVTVTGKKSGTRTFTVTQARKDFQIEGTVSNLSFRPGSGNGLTYWLSNNVPLSEATVSISIRAQGYGPSVYDRNWLYSPRRGGVGSNQRESISFSRKWNIQARRPRTATVTLTVTFSGITRTRSFNVTQNASDFWIMLHDNGSFRMGIYNHQTGDNFGKEEWRCVNGRFGTRMLRTDWREHVAAEEWVRYYWINNANFASGVYWSSSHRSDFWGTGRAERFRVSGSTFSYTGVYLRRENYRIRCLYDYEWSIY